VHVEPADAEIVSLPLGWWFQQGALDLGLPHMRNQEGCDRAHDVVLDRKNILELAIVAFCPTLGAAPCFN
jgi:hypothetical protein